jgi:hypothetical protein
MITRDIENATLVIEDIGVTLRTLLAHAASGYKQNPKRVWKVSYKGTIVGSVRLKTDFVKKEGLNTEPTD